MNRMFKIYDNINDTTLKLVLDYCVLKYKNEEELQKQEQFREFEMKICLNELKNHNTSLKKIEQYMTSYANALHSTEDSSTKANNVFNLLIENIFIDNYIHHTYRYINAKKVIIQYLETYYENENIIEKTKEFHKTMELKIAQELRQNKFLVEVANDVYNILKNNKVEPLYFQSRPIRVSIKDEFFKERNN